MNAWAKVKAWWARVLHDEEFIDPDPPLSAYDRPTVNPRPEPQAPLPWDEDEHPVDLPEAHGYTPATIATPTIDNPDATVPGYVTRSPADEILADSLAHAQPILDVGSTAPTIDQLDHARTALRNPTRFLRLPVGPVTYLTLAERDELLSILDRVQTR